MRIHSITQAQYNQAVNTYYLQFMGEANQSVYNTLDEVESVIKQKIEADGKNFAGFILSLREDQLGGKNMFGVQFPTWYALNAAEARFWLRKVLPTIKHKVATRTLALAKTDSEIEDEDWTQRELKSIVAYEQKYGAFSLN